MRVFVVCVLALATLAAAQTSGSTDPEIEAIVFKNWCVSSAQTNLDTSTANQKTKQDAFAKLDAVTTDLSGKFDKARDEFNTHNESIEKAKHTIATLTKRIARAEDKKKNAKTSFSGKFDSVNWSQVDNIVSSLSTLHDATTVDLVKSSLNTYKTGIEGVLGKIAKLDAKIEDFDKQRRDTTASLNALTAQSSRIQESYNFAKSAYDNQKKQSDAAHLELKAANKALQSAKAAYIACVNKGYIQAPATPLTPTAPAIPTSASSGSSSASTTAAATVAKSTASSAVAAATTPAPAAPTAPVKAPATTPKKKNRRRRRRRNRKAKKAAEKAAKKAAKQAAKAAKKAAKAAKKTL